MGTSDFPVERIHAIAAKSCASWMLVTAAAHLITSWAWQGYGKLPLRERLAWCNRIASAMHAGVLVVMQSPNLLHPSLLADPIFAVTDAHFTWGSVMYGYLLYDTMYMTALYHWIGDPSMFVHHIIGLVCSAYGLYFNRMAIFGMAIQVFFEASTPMLHILNCMRTAGLQNTAAYKSLGLLFAATFFVCRLIIANGFWAFMIMSVIKMPKTQVWAWSGVAIYGSLSALNVFWFYKIVIRMIKQLNRRRPSGPTVITGSAKPNSMPKDLLEAPSRGWTIAAMRSVPHQRGPRTPSDSSTGAVPFLAGQAAKAPFGNAIMTGPQTPNQGYVSKNMRHPPGIGLAAPAA